jgi:excisionase family DNA binding protein
MKRKTRKMRYSPATYSVREAGEILGISRNTAYAAVRAGSLPVIKIGGLMKVPRMALEKLLQGAAA